MTKFTLVSDLHLDFPQNKIPYDEFEKNVVVAGDTANGLLGLKFLNKLRRKGFEVFACPGNHEGYANFSSERTQEETEARFREEFAGQGVLDETVPIVLRNGWYVVSDEALWRNTMNDSNRCVLTRQEVNTRAWNDYNHIRVELQSWRDYQYKGIVVTHTAPCEETLDPRFAGQFSNEWYFNPYMRQLMKDFKDQIHVWCHGHAHAFQDKVVEGIRVVCNPRGYPGENPDWKPFTVELNND